MQSTTTATASRRGAWARAITASLLPLAFVAIIVVRTFDNCRLAGDDRVIAQITLLSASGAILIRGAAPMLGVRAGFTAPLLVMLPIGDRAAGLARVATSP